MVKIVIDDKELEAENGEMIIEVADKAGIYIPRFCYHKKLSIAANCRMCLVEVEKSRKPLPACATPVMEGMKVMTRSAMALESQRIVMEFLLINHPLDCPICDQGGQCELQDLSMGYGLGESNFAEGKRAVKNEDIGSLISTEMTRCIHCTRCVRFGTEVAGVSELGATGRGEHMQIGTYVKHSLTSEVSGNIIDLCPVGALLSKPFLFKARAWELTQSASIAPHDCVGSHVNVHTRQGSVMRVVPKEEPTVNETWLSDRDRFSYLGLQHPERAGAPMIKQNGVWQEVSWQAALEYTAHEFSHLLQQVSAEQIAGLIAPQATIEEMYLFQKLLRAFNIHNIDHRLRQQDFASENAIRDFPSLGASFDELLKKEMILFIGANPVRDQPILNVRIRSAVVHQGMKVAVVNPMGVNLNYPITESVSHPNKLVAALAEIVKVVAGQRNDSLSSQWQELISNANPSASARQIADQLLTVKSSAILLGALSINHPDASVLQGLAQALAALLNTTVGFLTEGPNTAGAWISGCVPHRLPVGIPNSKKALNASELFAAPRKGYFLYQFEPDLDCADPQAAMKALRQADWVVAFSSFKSKALMEVADVILPIAAFTETAGTFINAEGKWQSFTGAQAAPYQEARPGWKVLRVLGNLTHAHEPFNYQDCSEILTELKRLFELTEPFDETQPNKTVKKLNQDGNQLVRLAELPLYRTDSLVRCSDALQACAAADKLQVSLHPATAQQLGLVADELVSVRQQGDWVTLPWQANPKLPENVLSIPAGFAEVSALSRGFAAIELKRGHQS